MKIILTLITFLIFVSCTSEVVESTHNTRKVVQIEHLTSKDKSSEKTAWSHFFDSTQKVTCKKEGQAWYSMVDDAAELKRLSLKSAEQLGNDLDGASASQATLIIAALAQKGFTAVAQLAKVLKDTRKAEFSNDVYMFWYETKNKPPEEVELRVFAALQMEKLSTVQAYGVRFFFHKMTTNKGIEEVLYAAQGSYAVSKDDVCKIWLKWWDKNKNDF
jgi:hypothetical protein